MNDRRLRFCMITTFYPPYNFGGDGIVVHRLSNELAKRGHVVDVIHCADSYRLLAKRDPKGSYDDHPNVRVHGLRSPFGFLSPLATQQTGFPLFKRRRIRQVLAANPDVIHYHNISLVGGPGIFRHGQGLKLMTLHEYWLVCPMHVLFRFNRVPCKRRCCLPCTISFGRPPQLWRATGLIRRMARHVDAFITHSEFSRNAIESRGLRLPFRSLPPFAPSEPGTAEAPETGTEAAIPDGPFFLYAGRLERLKGVHTLIPVFRQYPKAHLLIAGTGTLEGRLRRLASGAGNIRFLGFVSQDTLQALARRTRAVLVPSLCYETAPLTVLEALGRGAPVIARDIGALSEIVSEDSGGLLYSTDDELVNALDRLATNPEYRKTLSGRGLDAHRRQWTTETHMEQYLGLVGKLLAARQARLQ